MTSTPAQRPSRPQTPSSSQLRFEIGEHAASFRSPSAPTLQAKITPSRTISQATVTVVPHRLHGSRAGSRVPSPGASVVSLDMNDEALSSEDTEAGESEIEGLIADDEERKRHLREQLRKTLKREDTSSSRTQDPTQREGSIQAMLEKKSSVLYPDDNFPRRQYFVFTDGGKPVFVRPPEDKEDVASITGIASALVSVFADSTLSPSSSSSANSDKLRCINAGSTRIAFLLRTPLYYVCVSKWGEPESVTRMHLEYLHLQILSVLTSAQLRRKFERRINIDLERLLQGTETFMHTLLNRLQTTIALFTTLSSLSSLRIDPILRARIGDGLVPNSRTGSLDILYAILISGDSIITIIRPKKHTVHPSDLYVLLNAVNTSSVATNTASWLPICLTKFNSQRFVHAYVSYLDQDSLGLPMKDPPPARRTKDSESSSIVSGSNLGRNVQDTTPSMYMNVSGVQSGADRGSTPHAVDKSELILIVVSGGGEFDAVRRWSDTAVNKLELKGLLSQLRTAVRESSYSCLELGIPGLRHFIYKSRVHVQATSPIWEDEYQNSEDQKRLITLYQTLHDAIHARSGQAGPLRLQYIRTDKEAVLGWITHPFELYMALPPHLPKTAAVGAANGVARWAKREEARLFLRDAPVF